MKRITIPVIRSKSLGHTVFRGSINANQLFPALWIDRYDEDVNPLGYQRPFNEKRSQDAANYAEEESKGFWPENILNIRAKGDEMRTPIVQYSYKAISTEYPDFGTLTVDYDETKTKEFGSETIPWERAFSEVDCQHRLGKMENSEKAVTICIFERLTPFEEALIFRVINEKQRKISTSLVDQLIFRLGEGRWDIDPTLHWAQKLNSDPLSPFYQKVDTGGARVMERTYIVKLRGLRACMKLMIGEEQRIDSVTYQSIVNPDITEAQKRKNFDKAYEFVLNYWIIVKELWEAEWEPTNYKQFKLLTTPGYKGLSMVGNAVFNACRQRDDFSREFIKGLLSTAVGWVDWDKDSGDFVGATGNAGAVFVRDKLRKKVVPVGVL